MTSPAEPPPTDPTPARQVTGPLRELVALVLLGANAVFLFVGLIRLLTPQGAYSTVTGRAANSFFAFIGIEAVVLPVLAVLLATHLAPTVGRAKLITQVALVEYAVSAVLGGLTLLIWVVGRLAEAQLFDAMTGLLTRVAWVALFAAAGYVVWSVWQRLYHVPRPKPEPGLYGTPQQGWPQQGGPGQFGGQPGHQGGGWVPPGQSPGQSGGWSGADRSAGYPAGYPGTGHPGPGQPYQSGAGQPGGYPAGGATQGGQGYQGGQGQQGHQGGQGQSGWPVAGQTPSAGGPPESPHTWPPHGQPAVPPQAAAPSSPAAPPFGQPASADPTQSIPRQGDPVGAAEPTQAIPRSGDGDADPSDSRSGDAEADRTQRIDPGDQPR
ncbi:hypothetical protein ACFFMR_28165 [Micromonospora andamanensis]|uniref:Uncharacterized protein n=1 Tax=Micromonospora andamanensis TaxID=1287068 RepID=A0ABQ4I0C1_9ACTN|nr:hypothetical protein [Micromonospora andamanensis]GIJ11364.1 hypothetical protein Van01_45780 [Micromonospora andamanensis]